MLIIACDPSTKQPAFAIYEDKKLIGFVKTKADFNAINKFFMDFSNQNFVLGIEKQYLHINVLTLIRLVEVRTLITVLAQSHHCKEVIQVAPQSWQAIILGADKNQKRDQRKYLSKLVASKIAKQDIADDDISDAICIGDYIVKTKFWYCAFFYIWEVVMASNQKVKSRFPGTVDRPFLMLMWEVDEFAMLVLPMVLTLIMKQLLLGILIGVVLMRVYIKMKRSKPENYLFHMAWKWGIIKVKGTTPAHAKTFIE